METYCCQVFVFDHAALAVAASFLVFVLLSALCSFFTGWAFCTSVTRGNQAVKQKYLKARWKQFVLRYIFIPAQWTVDSLAAFPAQIVQTSIFSNPFKRQSENMCKLLFSTLWKTEVRFHQKVWSRNKTTQFTENKISWTEQHYWKTQMQCRFCFV